MPELPEVEVTRRRLERDLAGRRFTQVVVRVPKLRFPVPAELAETLPGVTLRAITRRGKYLLFDCGSGTLLVHLGMTGFLRLLHGSPAPGKHDHLDFFFDDDHLLRFHDPRKFGIVTWFTGEAGQQRLLAEIGPEPLTGAFNGGSLCDASRGRNVTIKQLIMNSSVVAGVGNIYANEALYRAAIRPDRAAGTLTMQECSQLAESIRSVLEKSIRAGIACQVTEETVAYYPQELMVYGRSGEVCSECGGVFDEIRIGNRSTVFCRTCQI